MKLLRRKLNNGITVLMEPRDLPVVSFCIANKFGAIFENSKIKGVAHFIEHLLFTGTKTRTHEDISREIEKKGGILNASTWQELTSFWFKLPSVHLYAGMDILIDMLNNSIMNEEKFEKEKKVILEEIKMYHDDPQRAVYEKIEQNLYDKPFGELVIGNAKSVSSLNRDSVFDYYKKMYDPSNYIVVIVGDANFDKVCEKLENAFPISKGFDHKPAKIMKKNKITTEKRKGIDQAHFLFAMHAPLDPKNFHALEVLNAYLASGMSSQLFLEIREKRGLAYTVHGHVGREKSYAYYSIYAGTRKDAIPQVRKLILEGFKKAQNISEKEFNEAKDRLIGLRKLSLEESSDVMNGLLFQELISGRAEGFYEYEDRIKDVKIEDVRKIAKIEDYSLAMIVPA